VDKPRDDVARAVQLRDRLQLPPPQPPLHQGAVDPLADPPASAVDEVLHEIAARETDAAEVAHGVVREGRRVPRGGVDLASSSPLSVHVKISSPYSSRRSWSSKAASKTPSAFSDERRLPLSS
jgi:hypothetical protein